MTIPTKTAIRQAAKQAKLTGQPVPLNDLTITSVRTLTGHPGTTFRSIKTLYEARRNGTVIVGGHDSVNWFADVLIRHLSTTPQPTTT